MLPAYRVETPRLVLACPDPARAAGVKKCEDESRAALVRYMIWADREPESLDETAAKLCMFRARFDRGEDYMYNAWDRTSGDGAGGCGLHPRVGKGGLEIGYWVHEPRHRQGIATEMAAALTRVAFEVLDCRWVEIRTARSNVASAGVPRKLGYAHEATLHERLELPRGAIEDAFVFTLLARDYLASAAAKMPIAAFDAAGRKLL
ncbi:MAG TPA: GNAT family N-acetyltransferase [Labilithrix sp.]